MDTAAGELPRPAASPRSPSAAAMQSPQPTPPVSPAACASPQPSPRPRPIVREFEESVDESKTKGTKMSVYIQKMLDPTFLLGLVGIGLVIFISVSLFQSSQGAQIDEALAEAEFAAKMGHHHRMHQKFKTADWKGAELEEQAQLAEDSGEPFVEKSTLIEFYKLHDPSKVGSVDDFLKKYPPQELVDLLTQKYGEGPKLHGGRAAANKPKPKKPKKKREGYTGGCLQYESCKECVDNGCGWCLQESWCVKDEPGFCFGQEDHVGSASGHTDCSAALSQEEKERQILAGVN